MNHSRPFAAIVDSIRRDRGISKEVPEFDERNGNEQARFLLVLEAPGPKAVETGCISVDNPDPTAKNLKRQLDEAGVSRSDLAIWNAVPWYIGNEQMSRIRAAQVSDVVQGVEYLTRVISAMPALQCVVLVGSAARRTHVLLSAKTSARILSCHHPSPKVVNANPETVTENIAVFRYMLATAA